MPERFRLFGNELSPYSVKVRSYFRYKNIPHEWIVRSPAVEEEYAKYAKLPLVPLVVTPDGRGLQDSTPIIEHFEALYPQPPIHPAEPVAAFVSALLEEYGDEWGNKPMFHYRWFYEADQESAALRLAKTMMPDADPAQAGVMIKSRMVPRLKFVGSSPETKATIEGSFERQLRLLNAHLTNRKYLFGNRPAFGDFGLFAQLYEASTDPTPSALMRESAPNVARWIQEMLGPRNDGEFEAWTALQPTLMPFLKEEVAAVFVPWTLANARAIAAGEKEFSLTLCGAPYSQETQKYHAKSLAALRARYQAVADKSGLDAVLKEAGCWQFLQPAAN